MDPMIPEEGVPGMAAPGQDPMGGQPFGSTEMDSPLNKNDFAKMVENGVITPDMTIEDALSAFGMTPQLTLREILPFWQNMKMDADPLMKAASMAPSAPSGAPPAGMPAEGGSPASLGLEQLLGG